ncbi:hypothetical protein [Nitrosomonas marina]|uniref:Uncharacterized protein n=1 Tax=Nitrosomonas marina TaxID=917 RepID=A0A1H8HGF4_9PROT|nr:hypothetical protein [Nitrosomonas marina]SEN55236.1 hypothetical protein SAMN05216325_12350 [Nitrosomonas marina]
MKLSAKQQQDQIMWLRLMMPANDDNTMPVKKPVAGGPAGSNKRDMFKCYLSYRQIVDLVDFLVSQESMTVRGKRKEHYEAARKAGYLTDKNGNELTFGGFTQYFAIAMTKRKSNGDTKAVIRHCRIVYNLSVEITAAIAGIDEKEASRIIYELAED